MDKIYVASIKDTESNGMIGGFFSSTQNGAEAAVEVDQTGKPTAQAFMEQRLKQFVKLL